MVPKTKVKRTVSIKGKLTSAIFISYFTVFQTKVKYSHDFPISPLLYSAAYPTGALGVPCSCPHLHFPKHTFSSLLPGEDFMEIHAPVMEGGGCHWPKESAAASRFKGLSMIQVGSLSPETVAGPANGRRKAALGPFVELVPLVGFIPGLQPLKIQGLIITRIECPDYILSQIKAWNHRMLGLERTFLSMPHPAVGYTREWFSQVSR